MNAEYAKASVQVERKRMDEKKEITGQFRFDQDSKRFHRFQVETDVGIVGTIYIPKDKKSMPKKITLEYANKDSWPRWLMMRFYVKKIYKLRCLG